MQQNELELGFGEILRQNAGPPFDPPVRAELVMRMADAILALMDARRREEKTAMSQQEEERDD